VSKGSGKKSGKDDYTMVKGKLPVGDAFNKDYKPTRQQVRPNDPIPRKPSGNKGKGDE